jgi:hypothetical protein
MEQQERSRQDRRMSRERRVFADPNYKGPERRRSQERREGDRRGQR